YHLDSGPASMAKTLDLLRENGIPIAPHVLVGLDYGKLNGELEALDMIAQREPQAVVIIALSPQRGTPMHGLEPPSPEIIGRVITIARIGMESVPLLLGCARPIGTHKVLTDEYAVRSGVNGIAYISQRGVDLARTLGLRPVFRDVCCSLAPLELSRSGV
ncbi:MAG: radical SAM protein, partial [Candidatus Thorarchaeota archaeon]